MERFCDIGNMICQWKEMEGKVLEGGMEEGGRREGRKVSRRISELIGRFGEGGGSVEEGKLVKLDAGSVKLYGKTLSPKDILSSNLPVRASNHIETQLLNKDDYCMRELIG